MDRNELLNKLADYIDLPADIETEEDGKAFFDKTYGRRDTIKTELKGDNDFINEIIGKNIGKLENKVKQFAKEFEVEFEPEEFKGKKAEDIFEIALGKTKTKVLAKQKELETKANSTAPEEFIKKEQTLIQERDFFKSEAERIGGIHESFKLEIVENNRKNKLNQGKEKLFNSIPFAPEAGELAILGFKAKLESEIQLDLDEQENLILKDKQGNLIANPNKAGSYYQPEEYFKEKAINEKVYKLNNNPQAGKPAPSFNEFKQEQIPNAPEKFINPRALV